MLNFEKIIEFECFQVVVEKFGLVARFGFMHLIATNVSLWVRTVVWETANEWLHYLHHQQVSSTSPTTSSFAASASLSSTDYSLYDNDLEAPTSTTLSSITGISSNCDSFINNG